MITALMVLEEFAWSRGLLAVETGSGVVSGNEEELRTPSLIEEHDGK